MTPPVLLKHCGTNIAYVAFSNHHRMPLVRIQPGAPATPNLLAIILPPWQSDCTTTSFLGLLKRKLLAQLQLTTEKNTTPRERHEIGAVSMGNYGGGRRRDQ